MLDTCLSCFIFTLFKCSCLASALDLGALSVFNSTEDLNITLPRTSTVDITNAPEGFVGCFHQAPPDGPQLLRTNFVDCFNAEKKIAAQDTPNPIRFRRNDLSAFTLPNSFTYRTCVIFLDMVSADAEDFFYVGQIRSAAIDTARRCTAFPKALGGKAIVGPKKLMEVLVLGRVWPYGNGGIDTILLDGDDTVA